MAATRAIKLIKRIAELLPLLSCKKPAEEGELSAGVVVGEMLTIENCLGREFLGLLHKIEGIFRHHRQKLAIGS